MVATPNLRARKKNQTRVEFVTVAVELFLKRGYDATTIDQIVERTNYSRRTFFRYFASKEDLVFGDLPERVVHLREVLGAGKAAEDPLTVVREALIDAALAFVYMSDENLAVVDLWYSEASLHRRYTELVVEWEQAIVTYLETVERRPWDPIDAAIAATAMCGVVRAVLRSHTTERPQTVRALNAGFDLLDEGLRSGREVDGQNEALGRV